MCICSNTRVCSCPDCLNTMVCRRSQQGPPKPATRHRTQLTADDLSNVFSGEVLSVPDGAEGEDDDDDAEVKKDN